MKPRHWVAGVVAAGLALGGCKSWPSNMTEGRKASELTMGYGSLAQLLGDERSVDKLLLVKSVSPETEQLVKDIAEISATAYDRLQELSKLPPAVATDWPSELPVVEAATRDSIATKTALDLLFSADTFEVRLLMSQGQALRYGRFLIEAVAARDPNEARGEWLSGLAGEYEECYKRTVERLQVAE